MLLSAATALVRDRQSYLRLRNFSGALNVLITLLMAVVLLPPVFDLLARSAIGLPDAVAWRTYVAAAILLPWPAAIGFRRFYQGVLIRSGLTRRVAYGTIVRLAAMASTALALYRLPGLEGAWVGAAALSAGVVVEAVVSRLMAATTVRRLIASPDDDREPPTYRGIAVFYYPLALTSMLTLGLHPVVTFFMGHSRDAVSSLAVLLSFQRAMLVNLQQTSRVTSATSIEVAIAVVVLCTGIFVLDAVGAVVAAVALLIGRLAANLYLLPATRPPGQTKVTSDQ